MAKARPGAGGKCERERDTSPSTREWRGEVLHPRSERGGPDRERAGTFQMGEGEQGCHIARPLRTSPVPSVAQLSHRLHLPVHP